MKLVTIKNKYIFKPQKTNAKDYKPEQAHIYAVYKDKESGETRLIQMTHLYEPRKTREIKQKHILPVKLPNVEFPSGAKNGYYAKDIKGDPIDLKKIEAKDLPGKTKKATYVRKPLADKIIRFAKKKQK